MTSEIYLKRPPLELYGIMKVYGVTNTEQRLSQKFLAEAEGMEALSKHPHPNLVRYYGLPGCERTYHRACHRQASPRPVLSSQGGFLED